MSHLNPDKLHIHFMNGARPDGPVIPRAYTLTHSDLTGELFLTIGFAYNLEQVSGWYTRFIRDEVLAEWQVEDEPTLHVHCHVSGGLVFGLAGWRYSIFRYHLPMVLEALRYGDRLLVNKNPHLAHAPISVHFHAWQKHLNKSERWGFFDDYSISSGRDLL